DGLAMKMLVEEKAASGYRSSARRRAPTPSTSQPPSRSATPAQPHPIDRFTTSTSDLLPARKTTPPPPRKLSPSVRPSPATSPSALSNANTARQKGSEAFK